MGQKVHPYGFRLGTLYGWKSNWFDERRYQDQVHEDFRLRKHIKAKLYHAGISKVVIERTGEKCVINIHTARPGILIGKRGAEAGEVGKAERRRAPDALVRRIEPVRKARPVRPEVDTVRMRLEMREAEPRVTGCLQHGIERVARVADVGQRHARRGRDRAGADVTCRARR